MDCAERIAAHKTGIVVLWDNHEPPDHFLLVPMTAEEFENWWVAQDSFDSNPGGALDELCRIFGETPPPHKDRVLPGESVEVVTEADGQLWERMRCSRKCYVCRLCCDLDSYLETPDMRVLYHRGAELVESERQRMEARIRRQPEHDEQRSPE